MTNKSKNYFQYKYTVIYGTKSIELTIIKGKSSILITCIYVLCSLRKRIPYTYTKSVLCRFIIALLIMTSSLYVKPTRRKSTRLFYIGVTLARSAICRASKHFLVPGYYTFLSSLVSSSVDNRVVGYCNR
jgi:hypothetical protein